MRTNGGSRLAWVLSSLIAIGLAYAAPAPREENRFAWVPSYKGAELISAGTTRNGDQLIYKCESRAKDDGAIVRRFFENKLKAAGFTVIGKGGVTGNSWDLRADDPGGTRTIDVSGNAQAGGVRIGVTARMVLRGDTK